MGQGNAPTPPMRLLSIEWQRVQLVLRFDRGGSRFDPARLALASRRGAVMTPTRATLDGDVLCARYNVLQGPGRMPLPPGRWILSDLDGPAPRPLAVQVDDRRPILDDVRIPAGASEYVVAAAVEHDRVELRVSLRPATSPPEDRPLWRRFARAVPLRALELALIVLRPVLPRRGARVVLVSELSTSLHGNLAAIQAKLAEPGHAAGVSVDVVTRPAPTSRWRLRDLVRMAWSFARASTIVTDGHIDIVQRASWHVPTVQVWHGYGAFKQVGYSAAARAGNISPFSRALKGYSAVTVGSEADVPIYAEAFGIPEDRVHATGMPRLDAFFDPAHRPAAIERARAAFPQTVGRRTILFAPTYRGGVRDASYDMTMVDFDELHRVCIERDAVILVRLHPFVQAPLAIPPEYRDRILDGHATGLDVNDLLFIVDLLITDYSSVIYEFSTLDRPMLFYAFDLETYEADRGFYSPYESFVPGRIVRTPAELAEAIRAGDYEAHKVRPFARRHVGGTDGRSTDRVVDLILHGRTPARPAGDPFCR